MPDVHSINISFNWIYICLMSLTFLKGQDGIKFVLIIKILLLFVLQCFHDNKNNFSFIMCSIIHKNSAIKPLAVAFLMSNHTLFCKLIVRSIC